MSVLEQIKNNAISDLHLEAGADDVFDNINDFFDALPENSSLETIKLENDFIGDLRNTERTQLLEALAKVRNLQELYLADGLFMVNDLTKFAMSHKRIRKLTLKDILFQGVEEHFNACELALYGHGSLKEFKMEDCTSAVDGISLEKLQVAGDKLVTSGGIKSEIERNPAGATTA